MIKVHALLNLYNDRMFLGACLESLKESVDSIIIADGAYKVYYEHFKEFDKNALPWSTDGSLELIKAFRGLPEVKFMDRPIGDPNSGLECDCWENQTVKRTALIDAVPLNDWFIIIDADEMLIGDVQEGLEEIYDSGCIVSNTPLYNAGANIDRVIPRWHPRIFQKLEGMHYSGTHWHLRDKNNRIIETKYPMYWTDKFAFAHFKQFKTKERLIPHQNYMVTLSERGWIEPQDLMRVVTDGKRELTPENN